MTQVQHLKSRFINLFLSINQWCSPYFKQGKSMLKSERFIIGNSYGICCLFGLSLWVFLFFVLSCWILLIRSELLILRNRILKITLETNCNKFLDSSKCLLFRHFKLMWWSHNCFFIIFFSTCCLSLIVEKDHLAFAEVSVTL